MTIRRTVIGICVLTMIAVAGPALSQTPTAINKGKTSVLNPNIVPVKPYINGTVSVPASLPEGLQGLSCADISIATYDIQVAGPQQLGGGQAGTKISSAPLRGNFSSGSCSFTIHAPAGKAFLMQFNTLKTCPASVGTIFTTGQNEQVLPIGPLQMIADETVTMNIKVYGIGCSRG
jgi:hypothetical protein